MTSIPSHGDPPARGETGGGKAEDEQAILAEIVEHAPGEIGINPASLPHLRRYPRRRRFWLPLTLFLTTCVTTFFAGCYQWFPGVLGQGDIWQLVAANWRDGVVFMACVMGVLLLHEMGHFLMTLRYRVPASYPFFIPVPFMITGTMGAVIAMDPYKANRKEVFDIGLAGPLAGLVLTIPMIVVGIMQAGYSVPVAGSAYLEYGDPLLVTLLIPLLRDLPEGAVLQINAIYMAGWVGMLVTGLNMLPVSQLDGGHVSHAIFGRFSRYLGRGFLMLAIAMMVWYDAYNWILMLALVLIIGPDHPPTADDTVKIGPLRWILGILSLAIPVFCFPPFPLQYTGP